MISAKEARLETQSRLIQMAKEFIINCAGEAVQEAIEVGRFFATPSFVGVPNPEKTGVEVVKLLQEQGYEAKHVFNDGPNGCDNYILIRWEGDE